MEYSSRSEGLTTREAEKRLETYGPNELEEDEESDVFKLIKRQFSNVLIWILVIAAVLSFLGGEMVEFYFILIIIGIIVITGFVMEWKAEKAMEELQEMAEPVVNVVRDGKVKEIDSREVVPGDIVKLDTGDRVPADAEVIDSVNMKVDESVLTGESEAVRKEYGDEMYSGTVLVHGRGEIEVKNTGMDTKLGEIAEGIQEDEGKTPLQKKVDKLGKRLGIIAVLAASFILIMGLFQGVTFMEALIVTLALAVASIPEALPLTMTLTLSIGMKKLANKKAIVKKMLAVEALGSTTVICTDKTGTLTKNEMTVRKVYTWDNEFKVTGRGYNPLGTIKKDGNDIDVSDYPELEETIKTGVLCNNAILVEDGEYQINGDPTEGSMIVLGRKIGMRAEEFNKLYPRKKEVLFTSERKMMSTVNKDPEQGLMVYSKGAPEVILDKCNKIYIDGEEKDLTQEMKQEILDQNDRYTKEALRVLATAYRDDLDEIPEDEDDIEKNLVFTGLVAMRDPPREKVYKTLSQTNNANIDVKMITGDNPMTAKSIAMEIGLTDDPTVITGDEMDEMDDSELEEAVKDVDIFARTMPKDKSRLVDSLQEHGEIVAMTGDGVNDAPAVKKADVGVSMGQKGTEVTQDASDVILEDDDFSTLVTAIKGGRRIYDNIEKFTTYLVSRNFTQVSLLALTIAILGFDFIPLIALQILFLNVIGQEFPAISLGLDPAVKGIMDRPPRKKEIGLMHKRNLFFMVTMAVFMAITSFGVYMYIGPRANLQLARTATFVIISLVIVAHAFNFKSLTKTLRHIDPFNNKIMWALIMLTIVLTLVVVYVPFFQDIFEHQPLSLQHWGIGLGVTAVTVIFIEVLKIVANGWFGKEYMWLKD